MISGFVNSDEDPLPVEERAAQFPAPAYILSQEKDYYRKPLLRRADLSPEEMAPHLVLRLGLVSPGLVVREGFLLLPAGFGRRRRLVHRPSSGQHSLTGEGLLPVTATPASGSFAGVTGASPCPPVRTGFAGAGGPVKVASSGQLGLDGGEDSSTTPAPANILSQEKDYYR